MGEKAGSFFFRGGNGCHCGLGWPLEVGPRHGISRMARIKSKPRQRLEGYSMLYANYFADDPMHVKVIFCSQFRMNRKLFWDIVMDIWEYDTYFVCKKDYVGTVGFSLIQNYTDIRGCLHMELMLIHKMSTRVYMSPLPWSACIGSA
jgi:hypothetical protein